MTRPTLLEMVVIYTAMPASTALKKEVSSALKQRWGQLIKTVYEAPIRCSALGVGERCGSLPVLTSPRSSRRSYPHLELWPYAPHAPPSRAVA